MISDIISTHNIHNDYCLCIFFFPSIGTPTLHKPIHVLDEILENKNELEKQENLIQTTVLHYHQKVKQSFKSFYSIIECMVKSQSTKK